MKWDEYERWLRTWVEQNQEALFLGWFLIIVIMTMAGM
jgi:hypothetical protein